MNIIKIDGCTRVIGESQGYLGLPLRDITQNDSVTGPGTPAMQSAWRPSLEELDRIFAGGAIILTIIGNGHPPVMITVEDQTNPAHPDDVAVDRFAQAMKAKLAQKRVEGRGGWDDRQQCTAEHLSQLLREHVEKADPLDVANLAMMLHQRGDQIASAMKIAAWEDAEAHRHG